MNKYDDVFDEAEKISDEEMGGKLKDMKFDEQALLDLAVEPGDKEKIEKLISEAKAAADAKAAKEAWVNFGATAGKVLLKAMSKAIESVRPTGLSRSHGGAA